VLLVEVEVLVEVLVEEGRNSLATVKSMGRCSAKRVAAVEDLPGN
jgi:hypothetical protein